MLTGAGEKAFCAGADIGHMRTASALEARSFAQRGQLVADRIEALSKPVVAAVNGYALGGGCEIALACDVRVAVESARFGQPEVTPRASSPAGAGPSAWRVPPRWASRRS